MLRDGRQLCGASSIRRSVHRVRGFVDQPWLQESQGLVVLLTENGYRTNLHLLNWPPLFDGNVSIQKRSEREHRYILVSQSRRGRETTFYGTHAFGLVRGIDMGAGFGESKGKQCNSEEGLEGVF